MAVSQPIPKSYFNKDNTSYIGGDETGNSRGSQSIDVQAFRSTATQVASGSKSSAFGYANTASNNYSAAFGTKNTASGYYSSAFGKNNTASNQKSSAFGYYNATSGNYSSAFGYYNAASGRRSSAFGCRNTASGDYSSAFGYYSRASGAYSTALGARTKNTIANVQELGYWSSLTERAVAIRLHGTGLVNWTVQKSNTAYTDGGATSGSEADGTLIRSGVAFRVNTSNELIVQFNDAGTIKSLTIGTLA